MNGGQRPAVIIRGNVLGPHQGIDTVYLLHSDRIVISGGGFQYQQVVDGDQEPGFFDFNWVCSERSAAPLFDVQVAPGLSRFAGVQAVTILDYLGSDATAPHYLRQYPALTAASVGCKDLTGLCVGLTPIVALNCSTCSGRLCKDGCRLSGLTVIATSTYPSVRARAAPAVRVFSGRVDAVTILSPQQSGATDVVDADNIPVGSWVSRSGGGFTIVGTTNTNATVGGNAALTATGGRTQHGEYVSAHGATAGHAVLVGESGEIGARLALETSGAIRWGSGQSFSFDTTLERMITNTTDFEAQIPSGKTHTTSVAVSGAATADIASATLSTLGDQLVTVTARVAAAGRVLVVFKNEAEVDANLPSGTLRVAVTKFG